MQPYATVRTDTGYDVVDLNSGAVVGALERHEITTFPGTTFEGKHARPAWTLSVAAGGERVTFRPFAHGKCTVQRGAKQVWSASASFRRTLKH